MQYEDWKYHPSRLPTDVFEKDQALKQLRNDFFNELQENAKAQDFLKEYNPKSVVKFMEDYADAKVQAVYYSKYYIDNSSQDRELRYRGDTEEAYEAILQKKLFNLQCLWRAEQITIPEVRCAWDFQKWERNIQECPFIEPATYQEINLMRQYLETNDNPFDWPSYQWQDYRELMEKNEDGMRDYMPDWYDFYDGRMGTGALLDLPDLRTDKEEFYMQLCREERYGIAAEKQAANPQPPYVPALENIFCSMEERLKFALVVDDEIFQLMFKNDVSKYQERVAVENEDDGEDPEDIIIMHLNKIKDLPPVRGGLSWRAAIRQCWYDYLKNLIAEDIDLVWEEHKFYKETGLSSSENAQQGKSWVEMSDDFAENILRGRELAGEPRDFNF